MPLILYGYIGRRFLSAFFAVLLTILGLVLLFDLIELVRRAGPHAEVRFVTLLEMALLKLPHMVATLLPFAVMLGAMVVFWRLARGHELVVIRSAGVSVWQFITPIAGLVFLIGVINIAAVNPFAAAMYSRYEHHEDKLLLRRSNPLALSESGLWLREAHGDQQIVLHAAEVRQSQFVLKLRAVTIFVFENQDTFVRRYEAQTGALRDKLYDLAGVWEMRPGMPSRHHGTLLMPSTLTLAKIQENFASPQTISFWELPGFVRFLESAGFSGHIHRLYWQSLLASPILLCTMALIGAAVSMAPNQRGGGLLRRMVGGVAAGFVLYFFSKVTLALGQSQALPFWLSAWSPAAVSGLLGLASLFHYEDG
ncbi:MAG: LPS export ABC transporter permease LptG [Alphaproteobacteria bacterium]